MSVVPSTLRLIGTMTSSVVAFAFMLTVACGANHIAQIRNASKNIPPAIIKNSFLRKTSKLGMLGPAFLAFDF